MRGVKEIVLPELVDKNLGDVEVQQVSELILAVGEHLEISEGDGVILIVTSASGEGKDHTRKKLQKWADIFEFVPTYTTRKLRKEERAEEKRTGKPVYHKVSKKEFKTMAKRREFAEKNAFEDGRHTLYGTKLEDVLEVIKRGKIPILRIDANGAAFWKDFVRDDENMKGLKVSAVVARVTAPTMLQLGRRLVKRVLAQEEEVTNNREAFDWIRRQRWLVMQKELERMDEADFLLVNPDGRHSEMVDQLVALMVGLYGDYVRQKGEGIMD